MSCPKCGYDNHGNKYLDGVPRYSVVPKVIRIFECIRCKETVKIEIFT